MDREQRKSRSRKRLTETICVTSVVALMLFNFNSRASAQSDRPEASLSDVQRGPFPAPVGHAQPTPRDLPPNVEATEAQRTKAQQDFDKRLQICRNC